MENLKLINPENVSEEEVKNYKVREAVRAIVFDEDGKIALLHVTKENYYKLPGGGIEDNEDKMKALERECLEEIGCNIEVINEIGFIIEYRRIFNLKQTSYCYLAKIKGLKGIPDFTDDEKKDGFEQVWLSYSEALQALIKSKAISIEGNAYIVPRDITFLKKAEKQFNTVNLAG
jgi:8-oxo-dGTP pyrophosphatase MutT (NUDIX family)